MQYQRDDELGGGFKYFLFSPLFGEDSHFDQYFSNGLKPPTSEVGDEKDPVPTKGISTLNTHGILMIKVYEHIT